MARTTVFGVYDGGTYGAVERVSDHLPAPPASMPRQRLWRIVAKRTVLAAGATERPIVFAGNDRPGVMLAWRCGPMSTATPWPLAEMSPCSPTTTAPGGPRATSSAAGVAVADDDRRARHGRSCPARPAQGCRRSDPAELARCRDMRASGSRGIEVLTNGHRSSIDRRHAGGSGGWTPNVGMTCHLGDRPAWHEDIAAFVPDKLPPGMSVAGAANGQFGFSDCLAGGAAAAAAALTIRHRGKLPALPRRPRTKPYWISAALACHGVQGNGLRRPAERRHGQGHRDRRSARASARSSI